MKKNAIVLAAGKGTRMCSQQPKVLHKILEVPMAELIVHRLKEAGAETIVTITGYGHEEVEKALRGQCVFALQQPQLGTGHAVMQAKQLEQEDGATIVINGDAPVIQAATLKALYDGVLDSDMVILTTIPDDAASYGRVVRDEQGRVLKVVEAKDAAGKEKAIREINTGIYAFQNRALFAGLKELTNDNAQQEYYITDLVEIFRRKGLQVKAVVAEDPEEVQGVNDPVELARASRWLRMKINHAWMKAGVTLVDPAVTYIGPYVKIGHDVVIHPGVSIYGRTIVGNNVTILPGTMLVDAEVMDGSTVGMR
ncbi:MAG: bifunctional UDP-N-acetylglucosamine diphosphorylase/glucosamine-1-phosphate N-acetyltransferase GlmU [Bulleidia sp.]